MDAAEERRLAEVAEDEADLAEARAIMARIEAGEGTVPGEVVDLMICEEMSPLAAWRRYRGLSKAELARRSGLSVRTILRLDLGESYGLRDTRERLAKALDAPVWALEEA